MKQKRGQFYLIAAIIIIAIIIGFSAIKNYTKSKEVIKLYDLGEELGIESQNVLDYGTYNELNEEDMESLLNDFIQSYAEYIEKGIEISFIFGNRDKITVVTYEELIEGYPCSSTEVYENPGSKIIVTINETKYEFRLKPGENFYFVISQEIEGEQYIVTG